APQTSTVLVALGEVKTYDTTINRLGRATVTVLTPDRSTGSLTAAGGVTVALGNGTAAQNQTAITPTADGATERKGVLTFIGLVPATYAVSANSPDLGSGSLSGIGVSYNQELQLTVSITKVSSGFVGKVSIAATVATSATATTTNPGAVNARVTISGIVGYTNSVPTSASVDVLTDANGCFAILPTAAAAVPVSAACPAVAAASRGVLNLLTDSVNIAVAETTPSQPVAQQTYSVASASVAITAQPKGTAVTNGLLEVSRGTGWPLANANIQVVAAAPGAAGVTITASNSGQLTWNDPNFPAGNARPGVYKIRATLTGFDDSKIIRVTVPLAGGGAVTFANDDAPTVAANAILTPYSAITIAVVDIAGNAVANADVTLSGTTIASTRKSPTTGDNKLSFDSLSTVPTYSATIRVPGYRFTDLTPQTANCVTSLGGAQVGVGYTLTSATLKAPGNGDVATCSIVLTPLGSITGILRGKLLAADPTLTDLSGSQVVARKCTEAATAASAITPDCTLAAGAAGQSFQTITGSNGAFAITGSTTAPGLAEGYWQITATTNGYQTYVRGVPVLEQAAPTCAGTLNQAAECVAQVDSLKVLLTFTLTDSPGVPITNAVVTLRRLDGTVLATRDHSVAPVTGQPAWTNSYAFADVDPTTYSLSVVAAGKAPLNVNTITLTLGQTTQTYPLVLGSTANGISGGVYGQKPGGSTAPLVATVTINSSQTVLTAANGTDGQPMQALTTVSTPANATTDGTYHILNVPNGTWYVHVVADQYTSQVQSKVVSGGSQELANFQLTAVNHPVAVNLVSTNGFDLTGATAALSATQTCAISTPDASALTVTLVRPGGAGTTYSGSFLSQLPGTYYVRVAQPAGHLAPSQDCQSVVIPSASGSSPPAAAAFEVTEYRLLLKVATDPTAGSPANVPIAVAGATIAFAPTVPAAGAAVGTTYSAFVSNDHYDITATPDQATYPDWPAVTKTMTAYATSTPSTAGATETITVTQLAKVTVTVTRDGAPIATGDLQPTVTLTGGTAPVSKATASGKAEFTLLTPGTAYTASASLSDGGTYTVGPSASVTPAVGGNPSIPLNLVTVGGATVAVVAGPVGATVAADATATVQLKTSCAAAATEVRPATAADAQGMVLFSGLRPGSYGIFANFGGNTNDCTLVTVTVGAIATPTVRVINYGSLAVTVTSGLTTVGTTGTVQLRTSCDPGATDLPGAGSAQPTASGVATFQNLVAGTYFFVGKIGPPGNPRISPCVFAAVTARGSATSAVVVPEA
ncbi:MAG: Cna domain protein, partial [Jatrophihabitantaceae bacterium]|nr:Cna domain protein [Jatrophihabitantaceae bacterium]